MPMVDVTPSVNDDAVLHPEEPKPKPVTLKTAGHTEKTRLDDCIYKTSNLARDAKPNAIGWKDFAEAVKKNPVGLEWPITVLASKGQTVPLAETASPSSAR